MKIISTAVASALFLLGWATSSSGAGAPLTYAAHVQGIGWMAPVTEGQTAGTTGRSLRMEAVIINEFSDHYRAHVQGIGWMPWVGSNAIAGTTGRALRMEALQAAGVMCRAHVEGIGWMPWVKPGETCGTTGQSLRLEAVQLLPMPPEPPPPPPPTRGTRLAFTADTGVEATGQAVLSKIGSTADVTNIVGDFAYDPGLERAFCDQVNSRVPGRVAIVAGNHEGVDTGDGTMENYEACLPDEVGSVGRYGRDYFYDMGTVRVILISPDIPLTTGTRTYLPGTAEREWLKASVRQGKAAGKWTVLAMHHPCLSLGVHGCADTTSTVSDLAIGLGIDVVVSGHDHNYMRTHQVRGTVGAPQVVDSDNAYGAQSEQSKGSVFVIVGNGGHNPRTVGALTPIWRVANGTNSPGGFAYGYGELTATASSLSWRHVSAAGAALADSFTITKP